MSEHSNQKRNWKWYFTVQYSTALPIKVRVVEIGATLIFFFLFPLNFVRPRITQSGVHFL